MIVTFKLPSYQDDERQTGDIVFSHHSRFPKYFAWRQDGEELVFTDEFTCMYQISILCPTIVEYRYI